MCSPAEPFILRQGDQVANLEEYKLPAPLERVPLESDSPEILRVTEQRVQRALEVLNPSKACGPDRTPNWLLKESVIWWPIPSRKF